MSLINDALKRANEAQKNRPTAGPLGAPLQPADAPPRRSAGGGGTNWSAVLIPVIVVVLLALSFWFIRGGLQNKPAEQPIVAVTAPRPQPAVLPVPTVTAAPVAPAPAPVAHKEPEPPRTYVSKTGIKVSTEVVTREIPEPVFTPTTVKIEVPAPAPVESPEMKPEPTVATIPAPTPQPVVAKPEPVKPVFPELKLQGIFYRLTNPTALISSKNVHVGDMVQGVKVTAIERSSVTLEFKNERKTLTLDVQ
jgi:hypothetical protein